MGSDSSDAAFVRRPVTGARRSAYSRFAGEFLSIASTERERDFGGSRCDATPGEEGIGWMFVIVPAFGSLGYSVEMLCASAR